MDDGIIRKRISTMTTSRDLHSVLNVIKQNMAKEYGVEYYPISWDDYCYFSSSKINTIENQYFIYYMVQI